MDKKKIDIQEKLIDTENLESTVKITYKADKAEASDKFADEQAAEVEKIMEKKDICFIFGFIVIIRKLYFLWISVPSVYRLSAPYLPEEKSMQTVRNQLRCMLQRKSLLQAVHTEAVLLHDLHDHTEHRRKP